MLLRFALLASFLASPLFADRWVRLRSGPVEVFTDAGEREGRETLYNLEQFRHALGSVLGEKDLRSLWPIRIIVFESGRGPATRSIPTGLALAREAYTGAVRRRTPLAGPLLRDCVRILIDSTMNRLPDELEKGIAALFSTLAPDGSRSTLGQPPPEPERDLAWAMVHMLAVTPDYFGKLRVLVHNLNQGAEEEPAYRNAFGKTHEEIMKAAQAYWKAGSFQTVSLPGRVIRPEKEFAVARLEEPAVSVALADLLLANPTAGSEAVAAYEAVLKRSPGSPEALEGLGLALLRAGRKDEARKRLSAAAAAEGASARALVEYALLEKEAVKARAALARAAEKNPRWAAPHFEMARLETQPKKRAELLKTAAELEPRNVEYWRALAEEYTAQERFQEAAAAWSSAQKAAPTAAERERIRDLRAAIEKKRLDQEEEEKRRLAEEERRRIAELKQKEMESIRAALAEANKNSKPAEKVVEWWDEPAPPAKVEGLLQRVDCLGSRARLVVAVGKGKTVRLLIPDSKKLSVRGAGELSFRCGPQTPARKVIVGYFPRADAKEQTAGDAALLEFLP